MRFLQTLRNILSSRLTGFDEIQNFLDATNDPIFVLHRGELIKNFNRQVTELFGYDKHDLVESSILKIIKLEYVPHVRKAIEEAWGCKPGCKCPTFDVSVITKDGRDLICELDLNRTEYGIQPHFRDATEHRKRDAERELISNINKIIASALDIRDVYKAIAVELGKRINFDRMSIALLQPGNNAITTYAAVTSYGFTELPEGGSYPLEGSILEKVIKSGSPFIVNDTSQQKLTTDRKLFKEGIMSRVAYPLIYKGQIIGTINLGSRRVNEFGNNQVNLLQQIAPQLTIAIENSKLFCKIKEWNTELERIVEERTRALNAANIEMAKKNMELERANEELRSLDKMKDNIIRDVSHELKTPVAHIEMAMALWAEEVKKDKNSREKEEKYRRIITSNIRKLQKDIKGILHLSILESGQFQYKKEPIHLEELVNQVVMELLLLAEHKGLILLTRIPDHLPTFKGDREEITKVIYNLLDNAIKYTEKGRITISAETKEKELEISIEDTGIGIGVPKDKFYKLFERFYQEKTRSDGIGIGLAICKTIVDAHGGRIWAESDGKGKGTAFRFALPYLNSAQNEQVG
ncbi:MAG: GAF domain-containing protein [Planctomycetes bacterium]|nr:GAF domain-containing protein [Planctomycetota bacterium]